MELAHPMAHPIGRAHPMAGTPNGITRGQAASRSPDAADLPPTLVVFSKCGMEKEGGKSDAIISSCIIPISFCNLIFLIVKIKHLQSPNFLLLSLIGSLKFNPEGDAILFVFGDFWVQKKCSKS